MATAKKRKPKAARKAKSPAKSPSNSDKPIILIGHWEGRFGNRMHTYAFAAQYAKKFGFDFYTPSDWEGTLLFKNQFHKIIEDDQLRLEINQSSKEFDKLDYRAAAMNRYSFRSRRPMVYMNPDDPSHSWSGLGNVWIASICAYHPEVFKHQSLKFIKEELYVFSDEVKNLDVYKYYEDRQGTYDIAHLRRDDISCPTYDSNYGYSVISKESYFKAFDKFGYDPEKIEWTSDDWTGRWGVGKPDDSKWIKAKGGWNYPVGSHRVEETIFEWLPDFLRLYFARTVFRANSSFSFWASLLGNSKVFSPVLHRREIYSGRAGSGKEIDVEFVEGNHPHWLCIKGHSAENIIIPE